MFFFVLHKPASNINNLNSNGPVVVVVGAQNLEVNTNYCGSTNETSSSSSSTSSTISTSTFNGSTTNTVTNSNSNSNQQQQQQITASEHVYDNNKLNLNGDLEPIDPQPLDDMNTADSLSTPHTHTHTNTSTTSLIPLAQTPPVLSFQVEIDDSIKKKIDEKLKECSSGDSDSDSDVNVYTPKAVDVPSAQRLAKRLYYLDGFKTSDVVRHLSKKLVPFLRRLCRGVRVWSLD